MANAENEQQQQELFAGPGRVLREAREKKKLEIEDIAKKLRLKKEYIIGIENDDYSAVPSLSYVRGYLKSYAKLVDVSEKEVLAAFDSLGLTEERAAPEVGIFSYSKTKSLKKRPHRIRWISIGIFVIFIILIAILWQGKKEDKPQSLDNEVQQIILPVSS